jgi:hypothetical protein
MEEALPFLKRAIEINPEAHFGREKYQIHLYEYALAKPKDMAFGQYLEQQSGRKLTMDERQAAIKGVLGIMRFGNQDNPKVLKALASLMLPGLYGQMPEEDAKALAARALLKASYLTKDQGESAELRELADRAISLQTDPSSIERLEPEFRKELDDANRWYEELRERELGWIAQGIDADAEFAKLYKQEPQAIQSRSESNLDHIQVTKRGAMRVIAAAFVALVVLGGVAGGGVYLCVQWLSRPSTIETKLPK